MLLLRKKKYMHWNTLLKKHTCYNVSYLIPAKTTNFFMTNWYHICWKCQSWFVCPNSNVLSPQHIPSSYLVFTSIFNLIINKQRVWDPINRLSTATLSCRSPTQHIMPWSLHVESWEVVLIFLEILTITTETFFS